MELGSLLLIVSVAIVTGAFIAYPLFQDNSHVVSEHEVAYSALLAERERVLDALLELDFDYKLGKVPENIYPEQRSILATQASEMMERLESEFGVEDVEDDPIEALIAARREKRQKTDGKAKFCANCGEPAVAGDKFCSSCGQAI